MQIAIATNKDARGLMKDALLIEPLIEGMGHETAIIQYDDPGEEKHGLIICLEVISRKLVSLSEFPPILITNPEWLTPESIKTVQRYYSKVLCKTKEAYRICTQLFGQKARYTGFISEDRYDPNVMRAPVFLHVAGHSQAKNTAAVIDAWRWKETANH